MLARGCLAKGYREVLSPHVIAMMLTSGAVVACTFALVGTTGFQHVESPFERVAYAALYIFFGWPVFYALHAMQVHRSYWVATRHVTRSVRSGKRTLLRLTGDHKVPVSVTHMPAVRALLRR